MPPDVEPLLADIDFSTADELAEAYSRAWHAVAGDKYLASKDTQRDFRWRVLFTSAPIPSAPPPNRSKSSRAAADGMWIRNFEKIEVKKRRNAVFSGEKSTAEYLSAKNEIERIYRLSSVDMEYLRYFVRRAKTTPTPLCRSYVERGENDGKDHRRPHRSRESSTVLAGDPAHSMSDIPTSFNCVLRPKGTRTPAW